MAKEMNRFLLLPNADHVTVGAILELMPAINTWIVELMKTKHRLTEMDGGRLPQLTTIEERSEYAVRLMEVSDLPQVTWTIDDEWGDITVTADTEPVSVHVWHASTCNGKRRDFRFLNAEQPCECGAEVPGEGLCINRFIFYGAEELTETEPGRSRFFQFIF